MHKSLKQLSGLEKCSIRKERLPILWKQEKHKPANKFFDKIMKRIL